jgi:hypothetical protein
MVGRSRILEFDYFEPRIFLKWRVEIKTDAHVALHRTAPAAGLRSIENNFLAGEAVLAQEKGTGDSPPSPDIRQH